MSDNDGPAWLDAQLCSSQFGPRLVTRLEHWLRTPRGSPRLRPGLNLDRFCVVLGARHNSMPGSVSHEIGPAQARLETWDSAKLCSRLGLSSLASEIGSVFDSGLRSAWLWAWIRRRNPLSFVQRLAWLGSKHGSARRLIWLTRVLT